MRIGLVVEELEMVFASKGNLSDYLRLRKRQITHTNIKKQEL